MGLNKRQYTDGQTIITAANLNEIQDCIIAIEGDYVPKTRTVNGKALSSNISLTAANVGAVPTSRTINNKALTGNIALSAADVGAVPVARTVNSKALSSNITLSAADVGAVPTSRKVNNKALSADITLTAADVSAVPTSRKVNNKALSSDITLAATDIGYGNSTVGATLGSLNGAINGKVSKTGSETIDGAKTFTSPMMIDRSGTDTTVDEYYALLNVKYKNPQGYTKTMGVIRTYGDTENNGNNGIAIIGSTTGTTVIRAGESAEDVIKNESLSNSEDLNLITDNAVKIYVNANTASSVIKALGIGANAHLVLANNSEIYDNSNTLHLHTPPRSNGIYARYDLEPTGELVAQLTTNNGSTWSSWYVVGDVPRKVALSSSAFTNVSGSPSATLYRHGAFAYARFSGVKFAAGTYSGWTTFCTLPTEFTGYGTPVFLLAMDSSSLIDHGYPAAEARVSGTQVQIFSPEPNVAYWGSGFFPIGTWLS